MSSPAPFRFCTASSHLTERSFSASRTSSFDAPADCESFRSSPSKALPFCFSRPLRRYSKRTTADHDEEESEQEEPPVFLEPEKVDEEVAEGNEEDGGGRGT